MPAKAVSSIKPGDVHRDVAGRAARRIRDYLEDHPQADMLEIRVEVGDDDALVIPRPAAVMFAQIMAILAKGQGVQIIPSDAMLTTQQAADLLNVSRPFLIGLLESGRIKYTKVGRHRRICFDDLLNYQRQADLEHRQAADELAQLSEELDLY
jgi:excisionase family DNA binding protein